MLFVFNFNESARRGGMQGPRTRHNRFTPIGQESFPAQANTIDAKLASDNWLASAENNNNAIVTKQRVYI
jgi:hypothetical protein